METINFTKTNDNSELEINAGSREVVAIISTDNVDRVGDVVSPKGLNKKNFAGNPVVLLNHDHDRLPVAKALWVKSEPHRIIAKYKFSDKTQDARDVFGLMQDGILTAHSIGFNADANSLGPPTEKEIKNNPHWGGAKNVIRSWELHEFSIVAVGCNQDCVALAVAKHLSPELLKFLGDDWQPKQMWKWQPEELAAAVSEAKAITTLLDTEPDINPTYCKSWRDIQRHLNELMESLDSPDIILRKLKGQA